MSSEERLHLHTHNEGEVRLVSCKYRQRGCNMKLTIESMSEHKRSCPFKNATTKTYDTSSRRASPPNYVKCQFKSIGCDFVGTDTELFEHEHTSLHTHSKFLFLFCLKSDLKALEAHTKLQSVSSDLRHKIQQFIINLRNSQDEREADHIMLTSLIEQIVIVKRNLEENDQYFHEQLVATEDILRRKDEQRAALQKQLPEKSDSDVVIRFRVGVLEDFVFEHRIRFCPRALPMQLRADQIQDGMHGMVVNIMEICKFAEKKRQAMTNRRLALISDLFITSKGVKMKLKIFLNGEKVEGETCYDSICHNGQRPERRRSESAIQGKI